MFERSSSTYLDRKLPGVSTIVVTIIIVVVIIGIMAIFAVNPIKNQFAKARNATREANVKSIADALTQQATDNHGNYNSKIVNVPRLIGTNPSQTYVDISNLAPNYIHSIPTDPSGGTTNDTKYSVFRTPNGQIVVEAPYAELGAVIDSGGKTDYALSLNGLNSYVAVPDAVNLKYTGGDLTLVAWIKPSKQEQDSGAIFSKPWNSNGQYNYRLYYDPNGAIRLCVNGHGSDSCIKSGDGVASSGSWHYVVATIASDKSMKIYVDDQVVATGSHAISDWSPIYGDSNIPLTIGTVFPYGPGWDGSTSFSFDGLVDELAIYNRVLSADEIKADYNQGKGRPGVPDTGLVAGWRCDAGSGVVVEDYSGNNNDGTLVNGGMWSGGVNR